MRLRLFRHSICYIHTYHKSVRCGIHQLRIIWHLLPIFFSFFHKCALGMLFLASLLGFIFHIFFSHFSMHFCVFVAGADLVLLFLLSPFLVWVRNVGHLLLLFLFVIFPIIRSLFHSHWVRMRPLWTEWTLRSF